MVRSLVCEIVVRARYSSGARMVHVWHACGAHLVHTRCIFGTHDACLACVRSPYLSHEV